MALAPLAAAADLSALGVDISDVDLTALALTAASDAVRDAAGVPISRATSTFTVQGTRSQWLDLPVMPVASVATVEIDGTTVTDYKLVSGALWRSGYWAGCGEPSLVEVTATHGYTDVPADIVVLVSQVAAAVINAAADGIEAKTGLAYESIDDYRVGYTQGADAQPYVVELPERTRLALRRRFGGGVAVTRERA